MCQCSTAATRTHKLYQGENGAMQRNDGDDEDVEHFLVKIGRLKNAEPFTCAGFSFVTCAPSPSMEFFSAVD